jgi:hypothetical protein
LGAGQWARGSRRLSSALALAADPLCAAAAAAAADDAASLADRVAACLALQLRVCARQGRMGEAEECHARAVAILLPPHTFWPHALCTLSHAEWRDAPLHAADARVALPPGAAAAVPPMRLRRSWEWLAYAYSEVPGRGPDALAALHATLAALAHEPPDVLRTLRAASLHESAGRVAAALGQLGAAHESMAEALALALRAEGCEGAAATGRELLIKGLRYNLSLLRAHLPAASGAAAAALPATVEEAEAAHLASLERTWTELFEASGGVGSVAVHVAEAAALEALDMAPLCAQALRASSSAAAQRAWLLRAVRLATPGVAHAAAVRACRACAAPRAEEPLKLCARCGRVAYCGGACQKADWPRHKPHCTGKASATAEAMLADATCVVCLKALVTPDASDDGGGLATLLLCSHLAHAACLAAAPPPTHGPCPVCAAA